MVQVVLAGGGTAGHTSPLIATAQALVRADAATQLTCIGTSKGLETTVIPGAGLDLQLIPPVPMPRRPTPELLRVPARLAGAVSAARDILLGHNADVLVGFGGYVSMPAYLAARRLRIPVVIHEQNALPGLANKVASLFAARVAVTFPGTPLPSAEFIGMPLREGITDLARAGLGSGRAEARARFALADGVTTLLVSGGSQGARRINQATVEARDRLLAAGVQILHVWGPKNFTDDLEVVTDPGTGARYVPVRYVDAMEQAYAAADLMVGRAGAGTVVETSVIGLPLIAVPLPIGNGEQARNAASLVKAGAQLLVPDAELSADRLVMEVLRLADDPAALAAMGRAGTVLMPPDSADRLARIVLDTVAGGRR